jgi:glyoxylase-like metal-dependent hydrolase (beta-lactamase superfamily II)
MITVETFFDQETYTLTYLVYDKKTNDALIIDSVFDYDPNSSSFSYHSITQLMQIIHEKNLIPRAILETHAHADHVTGAQLLKKKYPEAIIAINKNITQVQEVFKNVFNLPHISCDGQAFDLLLEDLKSYSFGSLEVKVLFTPGHTPACTSFLIGNNLFTGDTLFMPDYGTGRCDFPKGSAEDLYNSVQKIYQLSDDITVYTGHDYQPNGRALRFSCSLAEQKSSNIHINSKTTKEEFIEFRTKRDKTLKVPRLLLPSIQLNIEAGKLPPADEFGQRYLKMPLKNL